MLYVFTNHLSLFILLLQGKRELIEKKIEKAKRRKKGIWKNGDTAETPAEYKRKVKAKVAANKKKGGVTAKVY
jgi:hypothetical protein